MKKFKNILILAGGDSSRFWPLKHKNYFSFLSKPLLQHLLERLRPFTDNLAVVINPEEEFLIKKLKLPKIDIIIKQKNVSLGQAGAVLACKDILQGETLILNANDVFDTSILADLLHKSTDSDLDCLLVAKKMKSYFPGGYFNFDAEGKLTGIIEKPEPGKLPSDLVKLMLDYFRNFNQLIKILQQVKSVKDDLYETALTEYIKQYKTDYVEYTGILQTVRYPWHILPTTAYFLNSLKQEIKLGKNVKIAQTAKIVGPCYIGDNTVIGDFTLIRESHIGKNCLIGGYCEVTRSYLADNVSLHRNYVGDSVFDSGMLMGAEAATANFRFDEKKVKSTVTDTKIDTDLVKFGAVVGAGSKIGTNSTLLPGIKIGSHTFIAPGYTIAQDVEDDKFIFKRKTVKNKHVKQLIHKRL